MQYFYQQPGKMKTCALQVFFFFQWLLIQLKLQARRVGHNRKCALATKHFEMKIVILCSVAFYLTSGDLEFLGQFFFVAARPGSFFKLVFVLLIFSFSNKYKQLYLIIDFVANARFYLGLQYLLCTKKGHVELILKDWQMHTYISLAAFDLRIMPTVNLPNEYCF